MNAILLTRHSDFEKYCANELWRRRMIRAVIVESGYSFERSTGLRGTVDVLWRNAGIVLGAVARQPRLLLDYFKLQLRKDQYLGDQDAHNQRVLRSGYDRFADDLPVIEVDHVNSDEAIAALASLTPDVVLVFGTRLIRSQVFNSCSAPFVNMHWGWSPDYRGEGIVSALALEGPKALGVTIHLLSAVPDGGDILYQARPTVDDTDNFYSIGLKLTILGVDLFAGVLSDFRRDQRLSGRPQDISQGRAFGTQHMKTHPNLYHEAWDRLKRR